jgi:hypothetical protein
VAAIFSYGVTATGPNGFQVSVTHPVHGAHLIGNFQSLLAAEMFADSMRKIDAAPSHSGAGYRIEAMIRRNHELIAAASKAWSEIRDTKLRAGYAIAWAMNAHWHSFALFEQVSRN